MGPVKGQGIRLQILLQKLLFCTFYSGFVSVGAMGAILLSLLRKKFIIKKLKGKIFILMLSGVPLYSSTHYAISRFRDTTQQADFTRESMKRVQTYVIFFAYIVSNP